MWRRFHAGTFVLVLLVLGCGQDNPMQSAPPVPPTTDDLIIADCYQIQAVLEAYAAEHAGLFPGGYMDTDVRTLQVELLRPNRYTGLMTEPRMLGQDRRWPGQIGVTFFQELPEVVGGSQERTRLVYGYRITGRGAHDVIITLENTASVSPEALAAFETLWESANAVAAALEQYFAEDGEYPRSTTEETLLGNSLIDFLPGGHLIANPITDMEDSPVDGAAAGAGAGLLGYTPLGVATVFMDYFVDVIGPDGVSVVFSFRAFSDEDAVTNHLMIYLQLAVEAFKSDSGHYPHDVDTDETPAGDTVLDLLSSHKWWPQANVYTSAPAIPLNVLATTPGDVGYLPVEDNGEVVGYVINGFGLFEELYRIEVQN
jgi:hypothetical protein